MNMTSQEQSKIMEAARSLAALFASSAIYRDYLQYKQALQDDPPLLERVKAFKEVQTDLEFKRINNGFVTFDEERRIAHQFTELSLHPVAGPFLTCEHSLLNLYRDVMDTISEVCEIE